MNDSYQKLIEMLRDIYDLRYIGAMLGWDMNTYMPPKGNDARSRQSALLAQLAHQKLCDPRIGELIERCREDSNLNASQKALLREIKRDRDKAIQVPSSLVRELSDTCGKAYAIWVDARKKSQFKLFAPILGRIVELKKQEAEALGYGTGVPYDALLDNFEPGASVQRLDPLLARTRDLTVAAINAINTSKRKPKTQILHRRFPIANQELLSRRILEKMGYDLEAGRLDRSVHPFSTSLDVQDVRITTRYDESYFSDAVFSTIHEAGHALYEQGFKKENAATPLAEAISMGIHESQSRLWENQIGRSLPFWKFFYPATKKLFSNSLSGVKLEDFYFSINAVQPSLIRVDADEVTYNLHVIIRYELEQAIFSGDLAITELPREWNHKMKSYLGVTPKKDSEGVLQDVHWSFGGFGYFPSYLLGNLYAAQWMHFLRKDVKGLDGKLSKGQLLPVKKWLNEKIHTHGRQYAASELVDLVTGEDLNPEYFDQYLRQKYGELYDVSWNEV